MIRNVLITGTSGFLGYNLCRDLGETFTLFGTHHESPLNAPVQAVTPMDLTGSLKPVEGFIRQYGIEAIIHCAAVSRAGACARNPYLTRQVNIEGTRALATVAQQLSVQFLFMSTDLVYNSGPGPHDETDADPHMIYSESKFDAEMEAFRVHPGTVVLRAALMFGNDDGLHGSFLRENERDLATGNVLTLFTDQYRTPVWSRDVARAVTMILKYRVRSQIFNIGGDARVNRYDLGLLMADVFRWDADRMIPVAMEGMTADAPYLTDCSLDCTRIHRETGWQPTPLREALEQVAREWTP
ncbi:NAD(P)-dependent oxidoreductase [bacterium]|nr:NAD(P)-dependent oxidoreductase [candidate division CSSED10-310 bacterium]